MGHSYTCILNTKCKAQPKGILKTCAVCGKKHAIWVCFRETEVSLQGSFSAACLPTGRVALTGLGCAKKVLDGKTSKVTIPVYEEEKLRNALLSGPASQITPDHHLYLQLYFEFAKEPA